mmetsp:Transcript_59531/g.67721  ORF Transcript_59531/g.67721 Transcript_59531/m.67721 type:complete len:608 (-) Transcript_59531:497-2320(-)
MYGADPSTLAQSSQKNVLYLRNLHEEINEYDLEDYLTVKTTNKRVVRDRTSHRSLCRAILTYESEESANRALEMDNYKVIKNKTINLTRYEPGNPRRRAGGCNLFIKNIPEDCTEREMHNRCSRHGNIISLKFSRDRESNRCRGYGFVLFSLDSEAETCKKALHDSLFHDSRLVVDYFVEKAKRPAVKKPQNNLYVSNIPSNWSNDDIKKRFSEFGEIISAVVVPADESGDEKNKGFGFVCFEKAEDAQKALETMKGIEINSQILEIHEFKNKETRAKENKLKFESLKAKLREENDKKTVFVKNIGDEVTAEEFEKCFKDQFTAFRSCALAYKRSTDGKAENKVRVGNFGWVTFEDEKGVEDAIAKTLEIELAGDTLIIQRFVRSAKRKDAPKERHNARQYNSFGQNNYQMNPMGRGVVMPGMVPRMVPQNFMYAGGHGGRGGRGNMMGSRPMMGHMPRGGPGPMGGLPHAHMSRRGGHPGFPQGGHPVNTPGGFVQTPNAGHPQGGVTATAAVERRETPKVNPLPDSLKIKESEVLKMSEEDRYNFLGEKLYNYITEDLNEKDRAGKLTGMLLEMDFQELMGLFKNFPELNNRITEAVKVLDDHEN